MAKRAKKKKEAPVAKSASVPLSGTALFFALAAIIIAVTHSFLVANELKARPTFDQVLGALKIVDAEIADLRKSKADKPKEDAPK
jgi:hypothetical protein